ncbi:hypothetical protein BSL78_29121 [Apostichopus japonicus]|uniref:Uncharacterized protein n=1 Tax=Stichopus japonicus TaxID=307972 RepID=A0A2G8JE84_STIJA|nr:hypothetical protein BSL78_29121 [Apostichopus japonicus]
MTLVPTPVSFQHVCCQGVLFIVPSTIFLVMSVALTSIHLTGKSERSELLKTSETPGQCVSSAVIMDDPQTVSQTLERLNLHFQRLVSLVPTQDHFQKSAPKNKGYPRDEEPVAKKVKKKSAPVKNLSKNDVTVQNQDRELGRK